jgi:hypothetical protein
MRAREFITEVTKGKIGQRRQASTRGLVLFTDGERWSGDYAMNRVMMAAASTDGTCEPNVDSTSWAGKYKTAHAYTKADAEKLKMAFKVTGSEFVDINGGDLDSEETGIVNKVSPIKPFGGY